MLKPAHGNYKSPGGTLTCKGKSWVNTMHKNKTYRFEIHVIDNNTNNLLSRNTVYKMELVTVMTNVNGCMKGDPVKIMLRKNVVPYCTPTARRILFSILHKVKKELQRLEEDDIIEKVTKPTQPLCQIDHGRK